MSWHHVLIILAALAAPLACGLSHDCAVSLTTVMQLSTMTIAGALGHAGQKTHPKKGSPNE